MSIPVDIKSRRSVHAFKRLIKNSLFQQNNTHSIQAQCGQYTYRPNKSIMFYKCDCNEAYH